MRFLIVPTMLVTAAAATELINRDDDEERGIRFNKLKKAKFALKGRVCEDPRLRQVEAFKRSKQ